MFETCRMPARCARPSTAWAHRRSSAFRTSQPSSWNQGLASLLVVVSGDTVRVFTLARIPRSGDDRDFHKRCLIRTLDLVNNALALRNLVYATESGRFWESNRDYFDPRERVDQVLLGNLTASHRLLGRAGLSPEAAQALLVQAMFVAYLEDREIIGEEYFRDASNMRAGDFETLLHAGGVESLERLFDTLRKDFNGDLFVAPCSFDANDPGPHLDASHLEILARFCSGREEMHGPSGQYRLWPYNFKYIPVELISAVHDRFLGERGTDDRRAQGAYYTPMFLADVVVSHVWDRLPPEVRDDGGFLDPACGSGIFLVRLFQRLCEHRREAEPGGPIPWEDLLDILSRLQGRDLDGGAVRVAVFSLYVALLDEVTPPDIRKLMKRGRVLPALHGKTLRHGDFFEIEPDRVPVDVVVGNPPWSSRRGERHTSIDWCKGEGLPAPGREQAWPFVWKSLRHLRKNGVVAFLLPAMGFLHNHAVQAGRGAQTPDAGGTRLQRGQLRGHAVPVVRRRRAPRRALPVRPVASQRCSLPVRVPDTEGGPEPEVPATDHDRQRRQVSARLPNGGRRPFRLQEASVDERAGSQAVQLPVAVSPPR